MEKRRGRQKKRWEDNIKVWRGMDFAGRPKAALLFRFLMVVLLSIYLLSSGIVTPCKAAHFALCRSL